MDEHPPCVAKPLECCADGSGLPKTPCSNRSCLNAVQSLCAKSDPPPRVILQHAKLPDPAQPPCTGLGPPKPPHSASCLIGGPCSTACQIRPSQATLWCLGPHEQRCVLDWGLPQRCELDWSHASCSAALCARSGCPQRYKPDRGPCHVSDQGIATLHLQHSELLCIFSFKEITKHSASFSLEKKRGETCFIFYFTNDITFITLNIGQEFIIWSS